MQGFVLANLEFVVKLTVISVMWSQAGSEMALPFLFYQITITVWKVGNLLYIERSENVKWEMAHGIQHIQATQFIELPSSSTSGTPVLKNKSDVDGFPPRLPAQSLSTQNQSLLSFPHLLVSHNIFNFVSDTWVSLLYEAFVSCRRALH